MTVLLVAALVTMVIGLLLASLTMNWFLNVVHFFAKARRVIVSSLSRKSRSTMIGRTGGAGERPKEMTIINRVLNRVIPKTRV